MPNLWQRLFRKSPSILSATVSSEFSLYADKAIHLIATSSGQLEDAQVVDIFIANSIPYKEAIELLLFLPTAFCRHMLPHLDWPTYYIEQDAAGKNTEVTYASNVRYINIQAALLRYLDGGFTQQDYLKIAARDSSFKSLNQFTLAGGKLENSIISPEIIVR